MSRSPSLLFLGLLLASSPARGAAILEVSGSVVATSPRLEVRVVVTNRGDQPAAPLALLGELLGERREAHLPGGVAPGRSGSVFLEFAPSGFRPGTHALVLLLEHPVEGPPDGAGNPPMSSERAFLLLALGANPGPAVRVEADPLRLDVRGDLAVHLSAVDASGHRVELRAWTARGLRAEGQPAVVDVPAEGTVTARLPLVRSGAPRGTRHAVLLVAETRDGPEARTTVHPAVVEVAPDPSVLPRVRRPLLALGVLLLGAALILEIRRSVAGLRRSRRT